jgi:hypothetical protein
MQIAVSGFFKTAHSLANWPSMGAILLLQQSYTTHKYVTRIPY